MNIKMNHIKNNLPVYLMLFMIFFGACNYIPFNIEIVNTFIGGIFAILGIGLTYLFTQHELDKNRNKKYNDFLHIQENEKYLYSLRANLECTVKNSYLQKGNPSNLHNLKYEQMNDYNNQVELYKAFILSTGLDYTPKFLYCKDVKNEKPIYVDSLEGTY